MQEVWREVTVNKDYEVSNLGNIRSNKSKSKGNLLKPYPRGSKQSSDDGKGKYMAVRLLMNAKAKDYAVQSTA